MTSPHPGKQPVPEPITALIARSSLGAPSATRSRARIPVDIAQRIVDAAGRRPVAITRRQRGDRR